MSLNTTSKRNLNTTRVSDSTTSLGSPFQCLTTLSEMKFFLISSLNHPWCMLRPFPLVLSLLPRRRCQPPPCQNLPSGGFFSGRDWLDPWASSPDWTTPVPSAVLFKTCAPDPSKRHLSSLDTLQGCNVFLVARGPKLNTVIEVWPHHCHVQGDILTYLYVSERQS